MRDVIWTEQARSDLRRLDNDLVIRIHRALRRFADDGVGDIKKLQGTANTWRLRVGEWRVLINLEGDPAKVTVARVLPRQSAYRS